MTHSIWKDLCKQPVLTASTDKHTKLIEDASTELQQPIESILSTLNLRSKLLTECANYDAALRDAKVMQQLSPSSALGYLREATIYSEQGKQHHVIDICNKGLDVVDSHDPDYGTLQRAKHDAEQHLNHRIDFIRQLPVDIVTTTLIPMITGDSPLESLIPCPYLHVSNLWRDCILQCLNGLRFETSKKEEENDLEKCSQLIRFSRHIKTLHVPQYSHGLWLNRLLRDNDFCSLRELYLGDSYSGYGNDIVSLLESIGSSLTHFTMHQEDYSVISVADVLSACPNLVSLTIYRHNVYDFLHLPMTTWPNITELSIKFTGEELTSDGVIRLGKSFPSLKKLHLYPCHDVESALLIPQYCSLLTMVELEIDMLRVDVTYWNDIVGSEELAMTRLSIRIEDWGDEDDDPFVDVGPLLRQYHTTLEAIEWSIYPERYYGDFYHIQYPHLKKLSLGTSGSWILRNAPLLEDLKMTCIAINADPEILDIIPPRLKKLELELDVGHKMEDRNAIIQYTHRLSQQCILHELAIRFDTSQMYRDMLDAIPSLATLKRLMIGASGKWDVYEMESFLDSLVNGCPNLSRLEINCKNAPSTYSLDTLKRLTQLKQFAFSIADTDGYDSFWHALRTFSQLKYIRIYPTNAVNKSVIQHLKEHRPDMKVIVDGRFKRF